MPISLYRFSTAKLNDSMSMLIGGMTDGLDYSGYTWFYNHASQQFIPGPALMQGRNCHTAGIITDTDTNEQILIVVGGLGNTGDLDSTEILKDNQWQQGIFTYLVV